MISSFVEYLWELWGSAAVPFGPGTSRTPCYYLHKVYQNHFLRFGLCQQNQGLIGSARFWSGFHVFIWFDESCVRICYIGVGRVLVSWRHTGSDVPDQSEFWWTFLCLWSGTGAAAAPCWLLCVTARVSGSEWKYPVARQNVLIWGPVLFKLDQIMLINMLPVPLSWFLNQEHNWNKKKKLDS